MVFQRRVKRGWWQLVVESVWPRGGWRRAVQYVNHRLRRLPDKPHRIARGIFAGVFMSFTPFYGLHFIFAAVLAKVMRGNILAALLGTFFGNVATLPFIAAISLQTGHWLLGNEGKVIDPSDLFQSFAVAFDDLWHNLGAIFTDETAHWEGLATFYDTVFLPYMVGGIVPGLIVGTISFHIALPLITAYQNRRRLVLQRKFEALRAQAKSAETT